MSYPPVPVAPAKWSSGLGKAFACGAAVAIAGAIAVGLLGGFINLQSPKLAILAGWLVGLTISRGSRELPAVVGAGALSLAGAALASAIGVSERIVKVDHVPFAIVAAHATRVLQLVPHFIGWFGFLCWALAALFGWMAVRGRGRHSPVRPPAGTDVG